ncbi:hypothetical protein EV401DRAFT_1923969 [Pisolithus croceorrhizus]|nr:hypothetical protein EV401DRAFT_1923969 [Pisolithus croceorrhizus]
MAKLQHTLPAALEFLLFQRLAFFRCAPMQPRTDGAESTPEQHHPSCGMRPHRTTEACLDKILSMIDQRVCEGRGIS